MNHVFTSQVIRIPETTDSVFNSLLEYGAAVGKTTVDCKVSKFFFGIDLPGNTKLVARRRIKATN